MIKNLKKFMKLAIIIAMISMIQPVFGAVRIFNPSLGNQAGQSFDNVLDTWDYLTVPGLFSNLKDGALSFGFTNDGKLTNANTFFGGGFFNVGLPIYLVAGIRNANTSSSNADSTSTAQPAATTTTNPSTVSTSLNNSFRVAAGTSFGTLGVQVFADLNASGVNSTYTNPNALTIALKTGTIEQRTTTTTDQFGLNVGSKSGEMVWNIGVAMKPSRASSATFESVDGTIKESFVNSSLTTNGAFVGLGNAAANNLTFIDTNNASPTLVSDLHERSGLVINAFGWMPMPLLTDKDILGWRANYSASTALGSKNYVVKYANTNTNDDWTAELDAKSGGYGDITLNPYLVIPRALSGEAGIFYINLDLKAVLTSTSVETAPKLSGKLGGTALTANEIATGFDSISATKCAALGDKYCDGVKTETSKMTLTFGVPLVAEININKSLVWIIGTFPKITYTSYKKTTTTTDLNSPKALTETVAIDKTNDGTISTAVSFSTGLKFKAADNFEISMLSTSNANAMETYQFSVAANYIFK